MYHVKRTINDDDADDDDDYYKLLIADVVIVVPTLQHVNCRFLYFLWTVAGLDAV